MKRAYVAQNAFDAQLVVSDLRAAGIEAVVKVDTVAAPMVPFAAVWVEDRDLVQALEVLRDRADPSGGAV